jgi:hypothetical protein
VESIPLWGRAAGLRRGIGAAGSGAWGAAIYSLIGTAKLNGLGREAYLQHVLCRIADHPISRIAGLLPWNVNLAEAAPVKGRDVVRRYVSTNETVGKKARSSICHPSMSRGLGSKVA